MSAIDSPENCSDNDGKNLAVYDIILMVSQAHHANCDYTEEQTRGLIRKPIAPAVSINAIRFQFKNKKKKKKLIHTYVCVWIIFLNGRYVKPPMILYVILLNRGNSTGSIIIHTGLNNITDYYSTI